MTISPEHGDLAARALARLHETWFGVRRPAELARITDYGVLEESPSPERPRN